LDILEGVLKYDLGEDSARFDGDVDPKIRNAELGRFKTTPSCRVLLATVQSGKLQPIVAAFVVVYY